MTSTTTIDTATALRRIRDKHAPVSRSGVFYERPAPLVTVPADLLKRSKAAKRLADAHDAYLQATALLDKADDALDDAESDFRSRDEWRARQSDIAARLARGEVAADAVESLLPTFSEADHLARCETHAIAVGEARKNLAARVADYDRAVQECAADLVPLAADEAERLAQAAAEAEAVAAAARARSDAHASLTRDLRLPEAVAALKAVGVGTQAGYTVVDRARYMLSAALVSPREGWSTDAQRYQHPEAAKHLGVTLQHAPRMTMEEYRNACRTALALGIPSPAMPDYLR